MKILFVTDGNGVNYIRDCVFHGLMDSGYDVIDSTPLICFYSLSYNKKFSLYNTFNKDFIEKRLMINRKNIEQQIKNYEFDLIIYGHYAYTPYLETVKKLYKNNQIIFLNGSDFLTKNISTEFIHLSNIGHIFIRELGINNKLKNIHPIYFALPESKFCNKNVEKIQKISKLIPGDLNTYIYQNEYDYYQQYQKSMFAFTCKKGGWDCLRHYEIISQKCLPIFIDFKEKPIYTMFNWPIILQAKVNNLYNKHKIDIKEYNTLLNNFFNYAYNNFTTKKLISYMLNCIRVR